MVKTIGVVEWEVNFKDRLSCLDMDLCTDTSGNYGFGRRG